MKRRAAKILVSASAAVELLRGGCRLTSAGELEYVTTSDVPADLRVTEIYGYWDGRHPMLALVVESDSFAEQEWFTRMQDLPVHDVRWTKRQVGVGVMVGGPIQA